MYKIMIVEDDAIIARALKSHMEKWGFSVECVADFQNIMTLFSAFQPHLVLLDIGLPFFNGYHWCMQIRNVSKVPVIFLSSMTDNMNIVMAMNMGGDDFICKPFDLNVATAKVQALLRRSYDFADSMNMIEHAGGLLNLNDQVFYVGENKVELTKNEYRILQCLLEKAGKVVSRDQLIERLWENESFIDDNTLTVNMTRLRKKLEDAGLAAYIKTKKGVGYIIE